MERRACEQHAEVALDDGCAGLLVDARLGAILVEYRVKCKVFWLLLSLWIAQGDTATLLVHENDSFPTICLLFTVERTAPQHHLDAFILFPSRRHCGVRVQLKLPKGPRGWLDQVLEADGSFTDMQSGP